jgi:hypothetical protein
VVGLAVPAEIKPVPRTFPDEAGIGATPQLPQCDPDRVFGGVTGAGPQRRDGLGQRGGRVPGEPGRRSSGTVMISERAWLMVCFGAVR